MGFARVGSIPTLGTSFCNLSCLLVMFYANPNDTGIRGALFGLSSEVATSQVILLPVPWDVTASKNDGTALGPEAIRKHSYQIDLYHPDYAKAWEIGIHMLPTSSEWQELSQKLRRKAIAYQEAIESGNNNLSSYQDTVNDINHHSYELKKAIREKVTAYLRQNKIVGLVGGDHSTALGMIAALAAGEDSFGILQIDAHADLRKAYQGFTYSHASIMHNVLAYQQVGQLVQVGVRDYSEEEALCMEKENKRITTFTDRAMQARLSKGSNWHQLCEEIIDKLPGHVYISFDIDGLDPSLAPHTGTPVPGGLTYGQAIYLLEQIVASGRTIIGFDLCEVASNQWDAIVGGRILYQLAILTAASQNKLT